MTKSCAWRDLATYFNSYEKLYPENPLPPIERIASIGARISNRGLYLRDREILRHTIAYLLQSGIPVSRDFSFIPVNIEYNTDFLETPPAMYLPAPFWGKEFAKGLRRLKTSLTLFLTHSLLAKPASGVITPS